MNTGDIFYCTSALESANIYAVSSNDVTANPRHNLLDKNLNTYWQPTTANNQYITIDTVATNPWKTVNGFGLWIKDTNHNYSTNFITLSGSNAPTTGFVGLKVAHVNHVNGSSSGSLAYSELDSSVQYRYYRISLRNNTGIAPKLGYVFLGTKHQMPVPYERNNSTRFPIFDNDEVQMNNRKLVHVNAKYPTLKFQRIYQVLDQAAINDAEAIWSEAAGVRNFFLYREDPNTLNTGNIFVCVMEKDEPKWTANDYLFNTYTFNFVSQPFIRTGETF